MDAKNVAIHCTERLLMNMAKLVLLGFIILMYPLLMILKAQPNDMFREALEM